MVKTAAGEECKKVTGTERITSREADCWLTCRWTSCCYITEVNCPVRNMVDGPSREPENNSLDLLLYLRKVNLLTPELFFKF